MIEGVNKGEMQKRKLKQIKVEPKYTAEELKAIDKVVAQEKSKGKVVRRYLRDYR